MEATIIYNENAGNAKKIPAEELQELLLGEGFYPVLKATDSEEDLDAALAAAKGIVITVGGDGTLRATALRLLNRKGVELAFIPAGTANNVAHAFGVQDRDWREIATGLKGTRSVPFDVGKATGPIGEQYFLEAFGAGIFADVLASYEPDKGKSVLRGLGALLDTLPNYEAQELRLALDGQEVTGQYILLEVLNTPMTGPHLNLAPEADPTDGLLDVVLIAASESEGLLTYARKMRAGELADLPNVTVTKASKIELVWTGFPLHIDAELKTEIDDPGEMERARGVSEDLQDEKRDAIVAVEVLPAALTLRLPPAAAEAEHG